MAHAPFFYLNESIHDMMLCTYFSIEISLKSCFLLEIGYRNPKPPAVCTQELYVLHPEITNTKIITSYEYRLGNHFSNFSRELWFSAFMVKNVRLFAYPSVYLHKKYATIVENILSSRKYYYTKKSLPCDLVIWYPCPPFINHLVSKRMCPSFRASKWNTHIVITASNQNLIHYFRNYRRQNHCYKFCLKYL